MSHILIQSPSDMNSRFSNKDRLGGSNINEDELDEFIEQSLAIEHEALEFKIEFDVLEPYLERIPEREADLIRLYYKDKLKQEQIAKLFGITQAAVSYRLHRGKKRIQFLCTIPELNRNQFELELGPKFNEQDREILWRMYETTCQSEIAKQMGLTQGRVRHRFFRALARIKELIAEEAREKQFVVETLKKQAVLLTTDVKAPRLPVSEQKIQKSKEKIIIAEAELEECISNSKYAKYYKVFFSISDKHFNLLHEVKFPQFQDRGDAQVLPIE